MRSWLVHVIGFIAVLGSGFIAAWGFASLFHW
jgi:hypothetical protein